MFRGLDFWMIPLWGSMMPAVPTPIPMSGRETRRVDARSRAVTSWNVETMSASKRMLPESDRITSPSMSAATAV